MDGKCNDVLIVSYDIMVLAQASSVYVIDFD